jgi:metal-responsive CopG/Arc/MetJ family transcriptional regulator
MTVLVTLPDDLVAKIDDVAEDRTAFVEEAVRLLLRQSVRENETDEIARINAIADELNRETEDVLEYQMTP